MSSLKKHIRVDKIGKVVIVVFSALLIILLIAVKLNMINRLNYSLTRTKQFTKSEEPASPDIDQPGLSPNQIKLRVYFRGISS